MIWFNAVFVAGASVLLYSLSILFFSSIFLCRSAGMFLCFCCVGFLIQIADCSAVFMSLSSDVAAVSMSSVVCTVVGVILMLVLYACQFMQVFFLIRCADLCRGLFLWVNDRRVALLLLLLTCWW